jgi:hypothetical protein
MVLIINVVITVGSTKVRFDNGVNVCGRIELGALCLRERMVPEYR